MKTQCPNCKSKFNVNEANIGKQAKCPKCVKPFTIEPFIETPVAVEAPVKSPEPAEPPAKSPEPVEATVKNPEPIAPPAKIASPAETPARSTEPVKEEKPESKLLSKALSKTVFVYCWMAVRIIAGIFGVLGVVLAIRKGANWILIATFAAADVFLVCSVLIELVLHYRMWAAIQDDKTSISPAKAVGFLFIPVFNIYWALLVLTGFAEDYNAFIQRRAVRNRNLPLALFVIYAVLFIVTAIVLTIPMICIFAFVGRIGGAFIGHPLVCWLLSFFVFAAGFCHFITYILVAIKTCNAINALPERKGR